MNEMTQTKEGFIRSMILFIFLLGLCFAPFIAFSNNNEAVMEEMPESGKAKKNISVTQHKSTIDAKVNKTIVFSDF